MESAEDGSGEEGSSSAELTQYFKPDQNIPAEKLSYHEYLRTKIYEYLQKNYSVIANTAFVKSKGVLTTLLDLTGFLGGFALDFLLCLFFFFFFLQKMVLFSSAADRHIGADSSGLGAWTVQEIFSSGWFPEVNEKNKQAAGNIIDRIYQMFNAWIRGYCWIIVIETFLYVGMFFLFSVPYALVLGLIAGCTILLPFLGPVISFALTVVVTLSLLETHLVFTLVGICLTYCLINGLLEQFILYPSLVGGAIGLTTLETIIVVLLGAVFANIAGMILAVPVAALLKFLIPQIYEVWLDRMKKKKEKKAE